MSILTIANLLLIFSFVSYFMHAYFRNTVDFLHYRHFMAVPVKNWPMKYVYMNSFILFMISVLFFLLSIAISTFHFGSVALQRAILAVAVVLTLGALRLLTMPPIGQWPKRAR